jgi:hypothetical protein
MERSKALKISAVALAVLVVAGLAVTAVSAMRRAMNLEKQAKTMTQIRTLYDAWCSYQTGVGPYCPGGKETLEFGWGNITADELKGMLDPFMPLQWNPKSTYLDGWDRPLQFAARCTVPCDPMYWSRSPRGEMCDVFIRSAGRDGTWDRDGHYEKRDSAANDCDRDIVWEQGKFVQAPAVGQ